MSINALIHAYLTKFVIARISGSFLYGLAFGKKYAELCQALKSKCQLTEHKNSNILSANHSD